MKVLLFSDLHIHDYKSYSKNTDRLENCLKVLDDMESFCLHHNIDTVFFAGDLFDTFQVLMSSVVNETVKRFKDIFDRNENLKIYAISGNHDQGNKNLIGHEANSSIEYLNTVFPDNFIIVDNETVNFDNGFSLTGIPYYEYSEHFDKKLDEAVDRVEAGSNCNYLMIHQTPKGIGNDMIPVDCVPRDKRFAKFDRVFCGHIHAKQELTDNFLVVGSPIHRDLGDKGQEKGFYVINVLKPYKGSKFIHISGYPEFIEKYEDEVSEADYSSGNFIVAKPRLDYADSSAEINAEEFSTNIKPSELVENYWNEVDGKDEDLLKTGLKFI